MANPIIIDNFLSNECFEKVQGFLLGTQVPWFFQDQVTYGIDGDATKSNTRDVENFFLSHQFIYMANKTSDLADNLLPLFEALGASMIIRAQANLFTPTRDHYAYGFHADAMYKLKSAVFYVNSNNGYTLFADGTRVDSVANRICVFDSWLHHTTVSATNVSARVIVNIVFIDFEETGTVPEKRGGFFV